MTILGYHPPKLYATCLIAVGKILKRIALNFGENEAKQFSQHLFSKIGFRIVEDIMMKTYYDQETWNDISDLFLHSRITRLICKWDEDLFSQMSNITTLKQIFVTESQLTIKALDIINLVGKYNSVDFDGELFWRGQPYEDYLKRVLHESNVGWLSSTQEIIRFLISSSQKIPKYLRQTEYTSLLELHLGTLNITTKDIATIIQNFPNLLILRNYKLVKALYEMHNAEWKNATAQQRYRLRNLDADFSYVGRCTLAVEPMLPMDALQLAVDLCPEAYTIRVRFDCSTHHDILLPLKNLAKLKDLSVVCVTNGERSLMDFTDIESVLRHHGNHLKSLELKVIDEVDTHAITRFCPKLEVLILSGSNYVTPYTCVSYQCSLNNPANLSKLKIFFFAEGGDTVCNNNVPQCFWYSVFQASDESPNKLTAVFMESPRIPESLADDLFKHTQHPAYPNLQILSICDYNELAVHQLDALTAGNQAKFVHLCRCQKLQLHQVKRWQHHSNRYHVVVYIN